jgi:hypothetical protein
VLDLKLVASCKGNYSETGMEIVVCKGARTDHYSRVLYVGLFLAKNTTLLTKNKRSELSVPHGEMATVRVAQGVYPKRAQVTFNKC